VAAGFDPLAAKRRPLPEVGLSPIFPGWQRCLLPVDVFSTG